MEAVLTQSQRRAAARLDDVLDCQAAEHEWEVQRWTHLVHFAHDYRAADATRTAQDCLSPLQEQLGRIAGDGTPAISEFAALELGAALTISEHAAREQMAAALDLWHRFPLCWQLFSRGQLKGWVAGKIVTGARHLPAAAAEWVDRQLFNKLGGLAPPRQISLAEGLVVAADRETARTRQAEADADRFVEVGQLRGGGVGLQARLDLLDAHRIDACLDRIADVLAEQGVFSSVNKRRLRAHALGVLAQPSTALALLQGAAQPALDDPTLNGPTVHGSTVHGAKLDDPTSDDPVRLDGDCETVAGVHIPHLLHPDEADAPALDEAWWASVISDGPRNCCSGTPDDLDDPGLPSWTIGDWQACQLPDWVRAADEPPPDPADQGTSLSSLGLLDAGDRGHCCENRLSRSGEGTSVPRRGSARARRADAGAAQVQLVVHISSDTADEGFGVARVEDFGPIRFEHLLAELRDCVVKIQPMIDLPGVAAVDRYEIPDRIKHVIWQRDLYAAFPGATAKARSCDNDHVEAWRSNGLSGQTGVPNLSPKPRRDTAPKPLASGTTAA